MVAWQFILIYMLGGALAGLSAGLLGIGGGLIVVPFLSIVLGYAGFPQDELMHVAVATSLLLIVFTSTSSMIAHIRKGEVIWRAFWSLLPGLIIGAIIGDEAWRSLSTSSRFRRRTRRGSGARRRRRRLAAAWMRWAACTRASAGRASCSGAR